MKLNTILQSVKSNILMNDIWAGVTVALILVPQSLAYAQLAGLPPQYGLYASLLPPVLAAYFGSSKVLSTGPVAILSLMTLSSISHLADPLTPEYISYALLLSLLLGGILLLLGLLRMGSFIGFLSHPVIYGFTNAAALVIISTQLPSFFGVKVPVVDKQYQVVWSVINSFVQNLEWETLFLGVVSLVAFILIKRVNSKLPHILIVVLAGAGLTYLFSFQTELVGSIPQGLPSLSLPSTDTNVFGQLLLTASLMALMGFTESFSVAQALAVKTKERLNPNKELIGQGVANIMAAFTQGFPVSGSFSRTALNFQVGGKTWVASLITSISVLFTLLFFTPLLMYIPRVVLAAVIIFTVFGLVDLTKFRHIWYVNRVDGLAALLTFFGTLYFAPDIEKGVILGVLFSVGHFVYRSTHPRVVFLSRYKDHGFHDARAFHLDRCENIAIVRLDAPLFFANAAYFENEIIKDLAQHPNISDILFVASGINEIDATGEEILTSFIESLKETKKDVYFSGLKAPVKEMFERSGLLKKVGRSHVFTTTSTAVDFLLEHINHAHLHSDKEKCPLIRYKSNNRIAYKVQKSLRENVAYYYNKILKK